MTVKFVRPMLALFALLLPAGCAWSPASHPVVDSITGDVSSSGAASNAPLLPDSHLTPGAALNVTVADISVPGYAHKVRDVPVEVKRQVYTEYGITHHRPGEYEVDHLISLELGGSNSIKNLWPQSYVTQPWNAHVKDDLENKLHDLVCAGQVPLATAQHEIAANWIAAYQEYFQTKMPLPNGYRRYRSRRAERESSAPASAAPANSAGQVWVNTRSGKYFRPDSPYYGHTREGQYMSETQAEQQGFVAARR